MGRLFEEKAKWQFGPPLLEEEMPKRGAPTTGAHRLKGWTLHAWRLFGRVRRPNAKLFSPSWTPVVRGNPMIESSYALGHLWNSSWHLFHPPRNLHSRAGKQKSACCQVSSHRQSLSSCPSSELSTSPPSHFFLWRGCGVRLMLFIFNSWNVFFFNTLALLIWRLIQGEFVAVKLESNQHLPYFTVEAGNEHPVGTQLMLD